MRIAKPDELRARAHPVLTARVSETELTEWFPVDFTHVTDPEEAPEPSKAALIKLNGGAYIVISWGEMSHQLTLEAPVTVDPTSFLSAFFKEVPLPRSRVLWHRPDAKLPATAAAGMRRHATTASGATGAVKRAASRRLVARKK